MEGFRLAGDWLDATGIGAVFGFVSSLVGLVAAMAALRASGRARRAAELALRQVAAVDTLKRMSAALADLREIEAAFDRGALIGLEPRIREVRRRLIGTDPSSVAGLPREQRDGYQSVVGYLGELPRVVRACGRDPAVRPAARDALTEKIDRLVSIQAAFEKAMSDDRRRP